MSAVPNHQTGRSVSLHTRGVTAMAGTFGYELDPQKLSEEEKKDYAYFEWNEWQDWYGVYNDIVHRVNALLEWFSEWSFCHFKDCSYEDRYPSGEQVRLIVYRC